MRRHKKIIFALNFGAMFFAFCVTVKAQQPAKQPMIGYLVGNTLSSQVGRTEAFRQGLRELGYVEGKNIVIDWQSADGKFDRLPALATELVRRKVEIIVTTGPGPTRAAKNATATIPIVMTNDSDPVGTGVVASLARPGGNITGLSTLAPELSGKRLEILREVAPKLSRVGVLASSTGAGYAQSKSEADLAAKALGAKLQYLDVKSARDIDPAFRDAIKGHVNAVLMLQGGILFSVRAQILDFAEKNRLPVIYHEIRWVESGGLMYYGVNLFDLDRRAAMYVDKILRGTKPADLPVEQPTKFEFIINLKAAKQLGLTIPPNVLARADRVIR
jgi:putative ABC transport system substrate-binding protein